MALARHRLQMEADSDREAEEEALYQYWWFTG